MLSNIPEAQITLDKVNHVRHVLGIFDTGLAKHSKCQRTWKMHSHTRLDGKQHERSQGHRVNILRWHTVGWDFLGMLQEVSAHSHRTTSRPFRTVLRLQELEKSRMVRTPKRTATSGGKVSCITVHTFYIVVLCHVWHFWIPHRTLLVDKGTPIAIQQH